MTKYKICMLGAFAVGKTSLVQRFVHSIFSERYQTTLGVKIDKKSVQLDDHAVELVLWDLAGEDEFMEVRGSYLRGSAGGILVADGTRGETLDIALELCDRLYTEVGEVPVVLIVNKCDLRDDWLIETEALDGLRAAGWSVIETSARTSENVEAAFLDLATRLKAGD